MRHHLRLVRELMDRALGDMERKLQEEEARLYKEWNDFIKPA